MSTIYYEQLDHGRYLLNEHPACATSWQLDKVVDLLNVLGMSRVGGDQCQYGAGTLRGPRRGSPIPKPIGFKRNSPLVTESCARRCEGRGSLCSRRPGTNTYLAAQAWQRMPRGFPEVHAARRSKELPINHDTTLCIRKPAIGSRSQATRGRWPRNCAVQNKATVASSVMISPVRYSVMTTCVMPLQGILVFQHQGRLIKASQVHGPKTNRKVTHDRPMGWRQQGR